jgi:hypothetical protein
MTTREALHLPAAFTPRNFIQKTYKEHKHNYAHFASPMVHPTTGKMITSYKKLMNDHETANVWQMAFGVKWHRGAKRQARKAPIQCSS